MVFLPDRFFGQLKTVTSFSFASVLPASRDLPSSGARPTVGLPSMWSKISSGSSWALPPWNSSSPGSSWAPAIWWFLGRPPGPSPRRFPSAELPVDWELLPSVSEPGPGWLGRTPWILGRPEVASALLALPGSKSLFYFWDIESEIHITLPLFVMII